MAVIVIAAFPLLGVKNIRKSAMDVGLTMIPLIVVSVIVMYYNYLRFGNPLDFGFGYMLTSQDMSHRGFIFNRYFLGFFEFLFQPFNINAKFPYIFASANVGQIQRDYMGLVVNEGFIAGFFWFNPLAFLSLGKGKSGTVRDKRLYGLSISCILAAVLNIAVDTQMSGISHRYMCDFSLFLAVAVILLCFEKERFGKVLTTFMILSVFLNYYALIVPGWYYSAQEAAPGVFYELKYTILR